MQTYIVLLKDGKYVNFIILKIILKNYNLF